MSEQYAFAVGFDVGEDEADQIPEEHWKMLYEQIGRAISESGLTSIESERWDEFGKGRIFWGTKKECESVKQILSPFEVHVEEVRNLDPGYYATPSHTYYVGDTGFIYVLPSPSNVDSPQPLETVEAMPLDAYRLNVVDPELHAQFQAFLMASSKIDVEGDRLSANEITLQPPGELDESKALRDRIDTLTKELESLQAIHATQIAPEVYAALEERHAQQTALGLELTGQIVALEERVALLQHELETKIDPNVYETVKTEKDRLAAQLGALTESSAIARQDSKTLRQSVADQNAREQELEQRLSEADAQIARWKQEAEAAIRPGAYADLQQELDGKTVRIEALQIETHHLQQQLQDSIALAAQKIDLTVYETVKTEKDRLAVQISALTESSVIARQDSETLRQSVADQNAREQALEQRLSEADAQIARWQQEAEAAIRPEAYADLQQELDGKTVRIEELQTETHHLQQQLQDSIALAAQKIDPSQYQALEKDVANQAALIEELGKTVQGLEREATEWQTAANQKVERSKFQALQEELQQLKTRQRKGLLSRLLGR